MNCYIHTPFCHGRCGYCGFYSDGTPDDNKIRRWKEKLLGQLKTVASGSCETVYLGGGTPTLPEVSVLQEIFSEIRRIAARNAEITIEANPETLTEEKLTLLKAQITRLSVGVQSFSEERRKIIGRKCTQHPLEQALKRIREKRFPHWNIDLIYAIPGETPADWQSDLELAASSGCDHLSCYNLTPEEGAALGSKLMVSEEAGAEMWEQAGKILSNCGFRRYEISNYAKNGAECRHNVNVWRGGLLLGFGPSAAGFDGRIRSIEPTPLEAWLAGEAPEKDELAIPSRLREIFAVNLRTAAGWTPATWAQVPFADRWENHLTDVETVAGKLGKEYFVITPEQIALTERGLLFWNTIAEELI